MKKVYLLLLIIMFTGLIKAQEVTVTGTITTTDLKEALPGANIVEKGTLNGTISDLNGKYSINVKTGAVLQFSFVGYLQQEVPVGDQSVIDVALDPDLLDLEEVVVVGYGTQKKSVVTGSIAKVSSEDLEKSKDLRIDQALQGRAAGVTIMANSGQPGDNLAIRIRGTGTNDDPDPLFIIDGLPMEKEGLDYLNPSDIESIEVLKDASSSAIYGARGANGVILVTTKQGKKNQSFVVTYDGYYGVQNPWKKLELLNSDQYISILNEAYVNDGRTRPYFSDETVNLIDSMGWNTDWQDEMYYYNAPKTSHSFSFTGGSENSTYSSSLTYYSQDGIVGKGKSNFKRINYRLNTTREFGKLKLGSNLNFANIKKRGISGNDQYSTGIIQAINMPPIVPIKFEDGSWGIPSDPRFRVGLQEITNPVALLEYLNQEERINKMVGNVTADYDIIKGLVFRTNFGMEYTVVNNSSYTPVYYIDATHKNDSVDLVSVSSHNYVHWNLDNTLTYVKSIGKHNFTVLAGITHFREWDEGIWAQKQDIIFDNFDNAYLDNAQNPVAQATGGFSEHTLRSFFGRINYNYAEKYLLEAVLRADGSSRFGAENRYGYFPAVSVGWVVSREPFFPENNAFNFAKMRFSWGQNGNENIGNFKYTSVMTNNSIYFFGTDQTMYNGIQPDYYANPELRWETSQQTDIGADLAFLNNRISLVLDYYDKRTKDWLVEAPAMLLIGNSAPTINGGEVKNSGVELEFAFKENVTKNLFINVALTAATNKSEVLAIENEEGILEGGTGVHGQSGILRAEIGKPLGFFYGYKTAGVFQNEEELAAYPHQRNAQPGDLKFVDTDTNGVLDDADRVELGNPYPKLLAGLNVSAEWHGVDFNMFWYAALGHQIYMANRRADLKYANFTMDVLDRWHGEGTSNDYPFVTISDQNQTWIKPSDFYVKDADYLRLKSITLGYTLPKKISEAIKLTKIRFYILSENLLTFTKYPGMEVEMGGGPFDIGIDHGVYPQAKTFIGGINITF